jgi:hypothetical protein
MDREVAHQGFVSFRKVNITHAEVRSRSSSVCSLSLTQMTNNSDKSLDDIVEADWLCATYLDPGSCQMRH